MVRILFVCHGSILRSLEKACYINGFRRSNGAYYTTITGSVKIYAQIYLQAPADLKSAGNRGVVQSRLQVLHVHVLLVAPLGARHVA